MDGNSSAFGAVGALKGQWGEEIFLSLKYWWSDVFTCVIWVWVRTETTGRRIDKESSDW